MIIISSLLGIALFLIVLHCVNKDSSNRKKSARQSRNPFSSIPINLKRASIADDMLPLVNPHVNENSNIYIFGSDGYYAGEENPNAKVLNSGISKWLSRGAKVNYIMLKPSSKSPTKAFSEIAAKYKDSFQIHSVDYTNCKGTFRDFIDEYITMHPTLIENEVDNNGCNADAMWLEGFHEPESAFAFDVEFISPTAMNKKWRREFSKHHASAKRIIKDISCSSSNHSLEST